MRKNLERRSAISSLSAAIIMVANSLCWPFFSINGVLVLFVLLALIIYLFGGNKIFHKETVPLFVVIAIFFSFSFGMASEYTTLRTYFMSFISLGFVGITVSGGHFDISKVVLYICGFSVLLIPFIANMDFSKLDYGAWMGISYGTLKYIIALILAIFFLEWKSKYLHLLLLLSLLFYIYIYAMYASRGAVLSLLVFIVLAVIIKFNIGKSKSIIILAVLGLTVFFLFSPIINILVNALNDAGLQVYALDKILKYEELDKLDNGRGYLTREGMKLFFNSPLFGNGIAYFEQYNKIGYVHNFVVQLLLEGGLVFGVPLIIISFYPIILLFDEKISVDKRLFLAFLFSSSVVGLLFSDTLWRNQCYWFYLAYSLAIIYKTRIYNHAK